MSKVLRTPRGLPRSHSPQPQKRVNWLGILFGAIVLSLIFYSALFGLTQGYPHVTGHPLKIDWPILVAALIPVALVIVLALLNMSSSLRWKFGQFEFEAQLLTTAPADTTTEITLDRYVTEKERLHELPRKVDDIRASHNQPAILRVQIQSANGDSRIEFMALRDYVFALSEVTSLKYIVFVEDDERYVAFMPAQQFMSLYPKSAIERLLDASELSREAAIESGLFGGQRSLALRGEFRESLLKRFWPGDSDVIAKADLRRLGAIVDEPLKLPLTSSKVYKVLTGTLPGVPVIGRQGRFIGIADKTLITQQIAAQLLSS